MTKIKDIPISDRPIERLINKGPSSLSNEELLAILIRTGKKGRSAKEIATTILKEIKDIHNLKDIRLEQLKKIGGVGNSKATVILAALELSKRINSEIDTIIDKKANNPKLIFDYYKNILRNKKQEHFYAIYLDTNKKIIKDKLLFIGTINYSIVHPRDIFKEAYLTDASSIILIHNHPTGNVIPSNNDIETTRNLQKIGELFGIKIIDHIIVGKTKYYSFFENQDI